MSTHLSNAAAPSRGLSRFSKVLVAATLFLIFAGALVTSTGSGLAVPDWPLSYGMVFPPMVGGVFYEHGHRLIASAVGFLTVCLAIWIFTRESRRWVRGLGLAAVLLVLAQGLLGGLTVILQLPPAVSIAHAVTGQTFFCLTVFIAYALSSERAVRAEGSERARPELTRAALTLTGAIYLQLILGAVMRHLHAGLAVYDFPTMAGSWLPSVSEATLARINGWAMANDQPLVEAKHVIAHLAHRFWAFVVVFFALLLTFKTLRSETRDWRPRKTVFFMNALILAQFFLGVLTVWSGRTAYVTSLHVVTGAASLGTSLLLTLRAMPTGWGEARSEESKSALKGSPC